ncbi:hypothetical protein DRO59_04810 [Candidatus Bathyarchaeota archaeon]|nr:MAG: hypothetical protein DRO59_04810 [Candidatus Bathyarchaeota archaeon]
MINLYTEKRDNTWFGVAADDRRLYVTTFAFSEKSVLQGLLKSMPYDVPFQQREKTSSFAERVIALLKDIYDGKSVSHNFALAMEHLSSYTQKVIKTVSLIPVGYVASYGSVAKAAGGSPRAVGRVMASNPFVLIVPCHRVVRSDFKLGGYGSHPDVKLEILKRERRGYTAKREVSVDGEKLLVFPVEFVLKRQGEG